MYFANSFWDRALKVAYNPWGTVTGRLGLQEGSFPILSLKNTIKDIVVPKWDVFVELGPHIPAGGRIDAPMHEQPEPVLHPPARIAGTGLRRRHSASRSLPRG